MTIPEDELERLGKLATEGDWFAGPLQPEKDTGVPGGVVSLGWGLSLEQKSPNII